MGIKYKRFKTIEEDETDPPIQKETITQNIDEILVDNGKNQYSDKYMRKKI